MTEAPTEKLADAEPAAVPAAPGWESVSGSSVPVDPLLSCLEFLTHHFQRPYSADVLKAGLPLSEGRLAPSTLIRAAGRAGLIARVAKQPFKSLSDELLPAIAILKDDQACVVLEIWPDGRAVVMLPETGGGVTELKPGQLEHDYVGYIIYARPEYRGRETDDAVRASAGGRWLWSALIENWWIYGQVVIGAVMINIFSLVTPLFIMTVYDRVIPNNAIETLWVLAIGAIVVLGFDFVVKLLRGYYIDIAGKRADVVLASRLFDRVLDLQMAARPRSAGGLANTLREFETVRDFLTSASLAAIVDLPFVGFFIVLIWLIGGPIALIPGLAVPLVLIVGLFIQIPLTRVVRDSFGESQAKHGVLFETLGGLETIKSIGAEGRMRHKWEMLVGLSAQSSMKARFLSLIALNFSALVQQGASVGMVVFGVLLIAAGELTIGALIAVVILNGRTVGALAQIAQLMVRFNQARTSYRALTDIMKLPVERPADRNFLHRPDLNGAIKFQEVTFTYPGQPMPAIKNISFDIKAGERVGIIGRVGSGKSTVHKLLLGLFQPDTGAIQVDGTDLRQIDPADLRRNIGCVPQDVVLFDGSVRENIVISAPFHNDEAVHRASVVSGVDDFVSQHPMGYDLKVGERGDGLSGGQRQSIAIARALLQEPPILLFDEPTSSMDNAAEVTFKERLEEILPSRTLVLVTHRASLLSLVDRLIVLDMGQAVADGQKQAVLDALTEGRVGVVGT